MGEADFHGVVKDVQVNAKGTRFLVCEVRGETGEMVTRSFGYTRKFNGQVLSRQDVGRRVSINAWTSEYNGKTYYWITKIDLVPLVGAPGASGVKIAQAEAAAVGLVAPPVMTPEEIKAMASAPAPVSIPVNTAVLDTARQDVSLACILFDRAAEVALSECNGQPDQAGFSARVEAWAEKLLPVLVRVIGMVR